MSLHDNLYLQGIISPNIQRNAFWGYLFVILITLLIAGTLGGISNTSSEKYRPVYALPQNVAFLIWFVALVFLAVGVYYGTFHTNAMTAGLLNILFMLQLVFFVIWFFVYNRFGDYNSAFWAGIILFILGLATLFFLWNAGQMQGSILVLLYLIWVGYQIFISWSSLNRNGQNIA